MISRTRSLVQVVGRLSRRCSIKVRRRNAQQRWRFAMICARFLAIVNVWYRNRVPLTGAERKHIQRVYDEFSGIRSFSEANLLLEKLGNTLREEQIVALLHSVDYSEGRILQLHQVIRMMQRLKRSYQKQMSVSDTRQVFAILGGEEDGGGRIRASTLNEAMLQFNLPPLMETSPARKNSRGSPLTPFTSGSFGASHTLSNSLGTVAVEEEEDEEEEETINYEQFCEALRVQKGGASHSALSHFRKTMFISSFMKGAATKQHPQQQQQQQAANNDRIGGIAAGPGVLESDVGMHKAQSVFRHGNNGEASETATMSDGSPLGIDDADSDGLLSDDDEGQIPFHKTPTTKKTKDGKGATGGADGNINKKTTPLASAGQGDGDDGAAKPASPSAGLIKRMSIAWQQKQQQHHHHPPQNSNNSDNGNSNSELKRTMSLTATTTVMSPTVLTASPGKRKHHQTPRTTTAVNFSNTTNVDSKSNNKEFTDEVDELERLLASSPVARRINDLQHDMDVMQFPGVECAILSPGGLPRKRGMDDSPPKASVMYTMFPKNMSRGKYSVEEVKSIIEDKDKDGTSHGWTEGRRKPATTVVFAGRNALARTSEFTSTDEMDRIVSKAVHSCGKDDSSSAKRSRRNGGGSTSRSSCYAPSVAYVPKKVQPEIPVWKMTEQFKHNRVHLPKIGNRYANIKSTNLRKLAASPSFALSKNNQLFIREQYKAQAQIKHEHSVSSEDSPPFINPGIQMLAQTALDVIEGRRNPVGFAAPLPASMSHRSRTAMDDGGHHQFTTQQQATPSAQTPQPQPTSHEQHEQPSSLASSQQSLNKQKQNSSKYEESSPSSMRKQQQQSRSPPSSSPARSPKAAAAAAAAAASCRAEAQVQQPQGGFEALYDLSSMGYEGAEAPCDVASNSNSTTNRSSSSFAKEKSIATQQQPPLHKPPRPSSNATNAQTALSKKENSASRSSGRTLKRGQQQQQQQAGFTASDFFSEQAIANECIPAPDQQLPLWTGGGGGGGGATPHDDDVIGNQPQRDIHTPSSSTGLNRSRPSSREAGSQFGLVDIQRQPL